MSDYRFRLLLIMLFFAVSFYGAYGQVPRPIRIGNPNPVGSGARALGQGNAFIAVADDATAASWNPGGLSQLERPEISFALEAISERATSRNKITNGMNSNFRETDTTSLEDFNYLSIVYPFFYKTNMVFSLNYLQLFRFDEEISLPFLFSDPPLLVDAGEMSSDADGELSVVAPAFGLDVTSKLSLGITFNIWNHEITGSSSWDVTEVKNSTATLLGGLLTQVETIQDVNRYEVDYGYSIVLGGMYRISKEWAVGGVVKPAYTLKLDNERVILQSTNGVPTTTFFPTTEADLNFPWILGLGVAWRPADTLTVSSDVTWTDWSDFTLEQSGFEVNPRLTTTTEELDDTYTLRLGGEYLITLDKLTIPLRCGVSYDPTPAIDEVDDYYTVNVGIGVQIKERVNIDFAYEYRWGNSVNQAALQSFIFIDEGDQDSERHRLLASMVVYF